MTEAERIERAAEAIYEGRNGKGCKPWSLQTKAHKEPYLHDAKVALAAADDLRKFVVGHWDNQDMNHEDFRVRTYQIALGDDPPVKTPPQVGLNWELSEETRKHLDEIERAIVRPGDPRLNQIICGSPTPEESRG